MPAWAVMPQLQLLSNGILVLSSGRPGLKLWARPTTRGSADDNLWSMFDIALEHNNRVASSQLKFYGHTLNATCVGESATACGHGDTTCTRCTPASDPPQTTAYTGLAEVEPGVVLLAYDKIGAGRVGALQKVYSMRITVKTGDDTTGSALASYHFE